MKNMLACLLVIAPAFTNAQSFAKGQKDLNFGIGFGNVFYSSTYNSTIHP